MRRWLRRIAIGSLALALLLAALWTFSRVRGPTPEQREALALFAQARMQEPAGRNAFAAMWLLGWEVPRQDLDAVAAEDAARFNALPPYSDPARTVTADGGYAPFRSIAQERYPDLGPTLDAGPAVCGWNDGGCLETVRADEQAYAELIQGAARLVENAEFALSLDYHRSAFVPVSNAPIPRYHLARVLMARDALWFVQGETDAALGGSCRAISGWRRIGASADSVILAMIAASAIRAHGGLLADMLAELPVGHALPEACNAALEPVRQEEMGICQAMRMEWETVRNSLDAAFAASTRTQRALGRLVFDMDATTALDAQVKGWHCGSDAASQRAADLRLQAPTASERSPWRLECVANPGGCLLIGAVSPAYDVYAWRLQDVGVQIGALRVLAWLRAAADDGRTTRERLAALPEALRMPRRQVELGSDGASLRVEQYDTRQGGHWSIPLPPALHDTVPAP